jgi:hypothetical protein
MPASPSQNSQQPAGPSPAKRRIRKQPEPARQPWEDRGWLRLAYLGCYARDPAFGEDLLALYQTHCVGHAAWLQHLHELWRARQLVRRGRLDTTWLADYLAAVRALAEPWGLHRLEPHPAVNLMPSGGEECIHAWCSYRASLGPKAETLSPSDFGVWVDFSGMRPDLRTEVRIALTECWDPRLESRAKARDRLVRRAKALIDAELQQLTDDAEAAGYRFADTKPRLGKHLQWLFEHVAYRKSYGALATQYLAGSDLAPEIYNRIAPLARQLQIRLSPESAAAQ